MTVIELVNELKKLMASKKISKDTEVNFLEHTGDVTKVEEVATEGGNLVLKG